MRRLRAGAAAPPRAEPSLFTHAALKASHLPHACCSLGTPPGPVRPPLPTLEWRGCGRRGETQPRAHGADSPASSPGQVRTQQVQNPPGKPSPEAGMARGAEEQLESLQGGCTVGYQGGEGAPTGSGPSGFLLRGRKCLGGHWGRRHSFWWGMRQEGPKGGDKQGSLAGGRTGRRGPSDRRAASRHREGRRADTLPTWVTPATSRWVHEAGPVTTTRPAIPVTRGAGQASLPMGTSGGLGWGVQGPEGQRVSFRDGNVLKLVS